VQIGRAGSLVNGWERWDFPSRSYANVHPNAHVRSSRGTRVYAASPESARAPRRKRRA
jgi:hypothetical protein